MQEIMSSILKEVEKLKDQNWHDLTFKIVFTSKKNILNRSKEAIFKSLEFLSCEPNHDFKSPCELAFVKSIDDRKKFLEKSALGGKKSRRNKIRL